MIRSVRVSDVEKYCPDSLWHLAQTVLPEHPKRHQGGGRRRIDDRTALAAIIYVLTLVPLVYRLIPLAGPDPSGSTQPSRLCQRCFPPSPASPGSGCAQLLPGCCDSQARRTSTSFGSQRLTAHQRLVAHGLSPPLESTAPHGGSPKLIGQGLVALSCDHYR
jgi:hypothetical protein